MSVAFLEKKALFICTIIRRMYRQQHFLQLSRYTPAGVVCFSYSLRLAANCFRYLEERIN